MATKKQKNRAKKQLNLAQKIGKKFDKQLLSLRTKETKRISNMLLDATPQTMDDVVDTYFKEDYLNRWYESLYLGVGLPIANDQYSYLTLSQKDDILEQLWSQDIRDYISQYSGEKITSVSGTQLEWIKRQIKLLTEDAIEQGFGVEKQVKYIAENIPSNYSVIGAAQIRRIVQTESLQALSVAADKATRSTGITCNKQWSVTYNNTRPSHLAMEGVTIDMDSFFYPDGEKMAYPRDIRFGASAGNVINCACTCIYVPTK